jgi:hypothetical protein
MCYIIIIYYGEEHKLYSRERQTFKYGPVYNAHIVYFISI